MNDPPAVVTELSLLGMAFFSWRSTAHVPPGAVALSVHRKSGVGAVELEGSWVYASR